MAKTFSKEDLELLGYINIVPQESLSPSSRPWKVFNAEAMAGIQKVQHTFVYLHSNCTKQDVEDCAKSIKISDNLFILTSKSGLGKDTLKQIFRQNVKIDIYEDLVWEKIKAIFQEYINSLGMDIPTEECYVKAGIENSNSPHDRLDDTIISYLRGNRDRSRVSVVSASAGVGKTTLSRQVVNRLAKMSDEYRIIPTYVESAHWSKLPLESVEDIWQIINNSLSEFSPQLKITKDLFLHALKQGYLVFIFDGFDELCGQRESHFNAREVLDWLTNIVRETDARIVITARTLFWNKEIGEECNNVVLHKLQTFEAMQTKEYFQQFFKNDRKSVDVSRGLYQKLIAKSQRPKEKGGGRVQFVNLPLCVGMVARFVKAGGKEFAVQDDGKIISQFLTQILDRERARQTLKTSAQDQLIAFEEIAVDCVVRNKAGFPLDFLPVAGFAESDIPQLSVHPFLQKAGDKIYKFSYVFLESYLLASYLAKRISSMSVNDSSGSKIMEREENGEGYVIEHLVEMLGPDYLENIGKYYRAMPTISNLAKGSRSFLFHVLNTMVQENSDLITMKEKTESLFEIIGDSSYKEKQTLEYVFVSGTINNLDFSNVTIRKSEFWDSAFQKCKANEHTRFMSCRFAGTLDFDEPGKNGWAQITIDKSCDSESSTNFVLDGILNTPTRGKEEQVKDILLLALGKFWRHGRITISLRKQHWNTGPLRHSTYQQLVLDAMLSKKLLSEGAISSVHEGGYNLNKDAIPDLQRFMDNRQLTGAILDVYNAILKKV